MICKYTQHHTYKARCLPQEIDISEVLRLPQKMTVILRKSSKSISPVTQKDFRHMSSTRGNVAKCHTRRTKKHINVTEQLSCENRSKVLRLSHKAIFDTLSHTSECHQAQRLRQNYMSRLAKPSKITTFAGSRQARPYLPHCGQSQTVANGKQRRANTPPPQVPQR